MSVSKSSTIQRRAGLVAILLGAVAQTVFGGPPMQVPTTLEDFFRGGSQWGESYQEYLSSENCGTCHGSNDENIPIMKPWQGSMHAQSARDPIFFACLAIYEQDAKDVGDMCMRCHVPRAWLTGRTLPPHTDGSAINRSDRDGINCHFCHLMADPFYKPGVSPPEDERLLNSLRELPVNPGSASYVIDRFDRRRGKRGVTDPQPHSQVRSAYFEDSALCETCHDVSKPTLNRMPDDTYVPNALGEPHPTGNKYDMFPLERTSSEWLRSEYAAKGVDAGGRFGGNKQIVSSCQDCHMPDTTAMSADFPPSPVRSDTAFHGSVGGNTFTPKMIASLYPDEVNVAALEAGMARAEAFLKLAATLEVTQSGDALDVRITNETGHKLPTGMPDGRRMWINVQFLDGTETLIAERGTYDWDSAELATDDTKVYEIILGLDEMISEATGMPVGPNYHGVFCNAIFKDNRIPPRGFTNEAFREIQSPPVAAVFRDGQYWDDTQFVLPMSATSVTVHIYYQTVSKEFVDFLRDANYTNDAGEILYQEWSKAGKSPPVDMVSQTIALEPFDTGDFDTDSTIDINDYPGLEECLSGPAGGPVGIQCRPGDIDGDNDVDMADVARFLRRFGGSE